MIRMGLSNKKLKAELSKHSKQDIVDAICHEWSADHLISNLLRFIFEKESNRALVEERKAFAEENKAGEAYIAWNKEVVTKYGDGKTVKIIDIPQEEYELAFDMVNSKSISCALNQNEEIDYSRIEHVQDILELIYLIILIDNH